MTPLASESPRNRTLVKLLQRLLIALTAIYTIVFSAFLASRWLLSGYWWFALLTNFTPLCFLPLVILLPLMLYLRARLVSLLLLALTLYAVFLFGRYYLPRQIAPASGGTTVSVTTFNMSDRNGQKETVAPWLRQQNSDIVFLQEIPATWATNGIAELRDLYPNQIGVILTNENTGTAILSRFPLRAVHESATYFRAAAVVGSQLIALYNVSLPTPVLAEPREPLYVVNALLNPIWDMAWGYDDAPRNQELDQLIQQVEAEPFPVIVAGDFNMSDFTPNYDLWASRLSDSFREAGGGFGATWPVFRRITLPGLMRLDYIWHSRSLQATDAQLGGYLGSDHLPVSTTLQF